MPVLPIDHSSGRDFCLLFADCRGEEQQNAAFAANCASDLSAWLRSVLPEPYPTSSRAAVCCEPSRRLLRFKRGLLRNFPRNMFRKNSIGSRCSRKPHCLPIMRRRQRFFQFFQCQRPCRYLSVPIFVFTISDGYQSAGQASTRPNPRFAVRNAWKLSGSNLTEESEYDRS